MEPHEGEAQGGREGHMCEWAVTAVGSMTALVDKWRVTIPEWKWTSVEGEEWPTCMVGKGNDIAELVGTCRRTPEWVIVDGGEFHQRSVTVLRSRHLKMWGVRGSLSIWGMHVARDHEPRMHKTAAKMMERFKSAVQTRLRKAYNAVGGARFKTDTVKEDFTFTDAGSTMAANPNEAWGEEHGKEDWAMQRKWEWPAEPEEEAIAEGDPRLSGVETVEAITQAERKARQDDYEQWVRDGMTWIDGFTATGKAKMLRFLHENEMAMSAVMAKPDNTTGRKFGKVEDFQILPEEYRPGARGKLWVWEDGVGREMKRRKITGDVHYNVPNILKVAEIVGFKDARGLQMLTTWGATQGTELFPLASYGARNHQGAATQTKALTDMMKEKVKEGHFACDGEGAFSKWPKTLPVGIIPVNGTVGRPKEPEMRKLLQGLPHQDNVRGTWDGSSPHDGTSPNESCELYPHLNPPWVTARNIVQSFCVLMSVGTPVKFWKLDLRRAYTQMCIQITQSWRQTVYWKWLDEEGKWQGGYARDMRMMWGMRFSGAAFYRTISTLTVKWITHLLMTEWMPGVRCSTTRAWSAARKDAGMSEEQAMAAFVQAFLDDFWMVVTSSVESDLEEAHKIVMQGFKYLGWALSMSKYEEEGRLNTEGILIGHHIETVGATRGVMAIKQARVRHVVERMLVTDRWERQALMETTGLVESIRDDMRRRISLRAMYKAIYGEGEVKWVSASRKAKHCMEKILQALPERRSLFARPTRWVIPSMSTVRMVPNGDASGQIGYAGVLWRENDLHLFHGKWSSRIRQARVNIAFLEAWVVVMIASTWGHLFTGKKVVIRSDSMVTCMSLNKLWAEHEGMETMCGLWEDLQFFYAFEGLVLHVPGKDNRLSDIGSRYKEDKMEGKLVEEMRMLGMKDVTLREEEVVWTSGTVKIDVEERLLRLTRIDKSRACDESAL